MKAAVLGSGNMGGSVLGHLKECEGITEIVAFDPNKERLDEVGKKFNVETTCDLDRIWRDRDIPLVFITSPNHTHHDLTVQALESQKAVLCEKPLATTLADAQEVVELSERKGAFLQVGFELRYSKLYTKVKEWIDAGILGEVVNTHCIYICSEFIGKNSWRIKQGNSGSMFGEKLSHYVDLPRWWVGSEVTDVMTFCSPNIVPYYEIRDNYHTSYRFANGAVSHLSFFMAIAETHPTDPMQDWLEQLRQQGNELRYTIEGTRGAAQTDIYGRNIKRWAFGDTPERMTSKLVEDQTWPLEENNTYGHNTLDQTRDIVQRVIRGLPPFTPARDSLETMRLCFAAEQSADTGRMVNLKELADKH
ncbi:MAG: Gfo/Idh/MocA family oxidoreductase [Phycisphaerae bacterium]